MGLCVYGKLSFFPGKHDTHAGGVFEDVCLTPGKRKNEEGNLTRLRKKLARRTKLKEYDRKHVHSCFGLDGKLGGCIDLSSAEKLTPLKRHVAVSGIFARSPFEEDAELPGVIKEISIKKYRQITRCTDEELERYVCSERVCVEGV